MKQNDSVFRAVCALFNVESFDDAVTLSKDDKASVIAMVTQGIVSGMVDFSDEAKAKYDTADKIKGYVNGMVSNHLRKDKRLNGGEKYEIKNPGSRVKDETIKALKQLRSTITDAEQLKMIDDSIAERLALLTQAKTVEINVDALPEAFRHLVK